ncbi:U5 small nuclear ribonucleoprotein TSSC4 [Ahaetulla prasina]|uniref:U5 small nuclear ribonucleoprotein TSSC4 n=1 Tax=Ahaetulla prasina TaxID=499056 RepID=UPI0026489C14|nr:U5 small nuclear ribonucleoprotein TSSC4 [Ahaetulla prasina]XP_058013943.1 U5 small nuclear ribonucleoprotein TSSC4 [Ahaetulla prasina]XP_058013951.1 U5 small nuclear ribonucleoprotein TSSC4 [Ahaetulla prasina]XP_058013959.1 U5 small nuclear ribonucleoprotein TSSC4 [Ahaetulla prasina]XP_058013967.1 U5 small nuclear ribonucleoprotein TSSC4 [Ahaetulla prasina]XP_058013975.1 U5 small nuclear ribonucleoprotein TSSC4 [Ahaetulla prasina]XP_058013984.1 U5 small nuclear ribonucleoprotein TSSC4 [Ah
MGDEGAGEPFVGIVTDGAADYEGILPSDTISLSDSDSEDFEFAGSAEVDIVSPEESLPSDDVDCESKKSGDSLHNSQKSVVQPFHLKGMSSSFSQRSQNIFDCLEGAAKQAVPAGEDNVIDKRFKRPLPPLSISNKMPAENFGRQREPIQSYKSSPPVPDYVAHPERWTKYSLENVAECSDDTNRSIAMEFLSGLNKGKKEQSSTRPENFIPSFNQDASSSGAGRIIFSKPVKAGLDRSDKKRGTSTEEKLEANIINANQETSGRPLGNLDAQNKGDVLDPSESKEGKKEDWEPLKLEERGARRANTGSPEVPEENVTTTIGFHGSKKRSRKHFRPKANHDEEEES